MQKVLDFGTGFGLMQWFHEELKVVLKILAALASRDGLPNQVIDVSVIKNNVGHGASLFGCLYGLLWRVLGSPNELSWDLY